MIQLYTLFWIVAVLISILVTVEMGTAMGQARMFPEGWSYWFMFWFCVGLTGFALCVRYNPWEISL